MSATIALEVFRFQPEESAEAVYRTYEVPCPDDWVILDGLNHIKNEIDGTLSYRWSCRMGVCGSCGMQANGEPVLTCATYLRDFLPGPLRIEPLAHFPVVRDLVTDVSDFIEKLESVQPWMIREQQKPLEEGEYDQSPGQLVDYKQFTLCINCTLCYAACPIYGRHVAFVGPAAIALGHRYNLDSRDEGNGDRHDVIAGPDGVWECTFVGDCSRVCPKHVDPAGAIQQAKAAAAAVEINSMLMPWRKK
ncbi:MAG: succinate dehydrogenase iron-sulfur subunit [Planctomycetota bacterium]